MGTEEKLRRVLHTLSSPIPYLILSYGQTDPEKAIFTWVKTKVQENRRYISSWYNFINKYKV